MISEFIVYIHPELHLYFDGDQYMVLTKGGIPKGSVLLIEQGLVETKARLKSFLRYQNALVTDLYPRQSESCDDDLDTKLMYNSWDWERGELGLFFNLSKFNHSCSPNAFFSVLDVNDNHPFLQTVVCVAIADIPPQTEVSIMYHSNAGHECDVFNWNCNCGLNQDQRKSVFRHAISEAKKWKSFHQSSIESIVEVFEKQQTLLRASVLAFGNAIDSWSIASLTNAMSNATIHNDDQSFDPDPNSEMLSYALQNFDEVMVADLLDQNVPIEGYDKPNLCGWVKLLIEQSDEYYFLYDKLVAYARRNKDGYLLSSLQIS